MRMNDNNTLLSKARLRANAARVWRWLQALGRGIRLVWSAAGYYVALALLLILLGSAAYAYRQRPRQNVRAALPTALPPIEDPGTPAWSGEALFPTPTPEPTPRPFALNKPVPGEVLQDYSGDAPLWSATLGQWQTHRAVDFQAELGEAVCAAEAGVVAGAYRDPLLGNVVELQHENGWVTRYASLNTMALVEIGQSVQKGDIIGAAGDSAAAEADLGAHVHFELLIDGVPTHPEFHTVSVAQKDARQSAP